MKRILLAVSLFGLATQSFGQSPAVISLPVNTACNKVGVDSENTLCTYYPAKNEVICTSSTDRAYKKVFVVTDHRAAATATPGFLMYHNYLGYVVQEAPSTNMLGSGKRIDLCLAKNN